MLFDKAIRKRQLLLPIQGYHELDSPITSGQPEFTLQPQEFEPNFYDELVTWPANFDLLAHWQTVPVESEGVNVGEVISGNSFRQKAFYAEATADSPDLSRASAYSCIRIFYKNVVTGQSSSHGSLLKIAMCEGELIYEKKFKIQSPGELIQLREQLPGGKWLVTSPVAAEKGENIVPLLGYGCYAPSTCDFSQIEQVYASIGSTGKEVSVKLYKESYLRQQGVVPPTGGTIQDWRYLFIGDNNPSLVSDIINNRIRIKVMLGDHIRTYVSIAHRQVSQLDQLIYLTFKPEEGGK